jgi:hypothetical protein
MANGEVMAEVTMQAVASEWWRWMLAGVRS